MAKNTFRIEGEFVLTDKGTLKAIGKKADKTSSSMDKVSKSSASADRNIKGVANASSNATKNFSKMSQGISGELVRSYAILAANVFALTAVFNALKEASQLTQLREGLEFIGRAAGTNLPEVANKLQEISDGAINASEAMRSVAIGISAGFSPDQIQSLTKVAKGASIALGRDMTDALNRLTRGAAKLEPELLDELGIMARLEEATGKYATKVNKTANQLTTFERSQAFLNEIIEQGELKFGQIADSVDPSPYQQLAAAFNDLKLSGLEFINNFVTPLISFLGNSGTGLLGVMLLFGSTITKQVLPAVLELSTSAAAKADIFADSISEAFADAAKSSSKFPKEFNKSIQSLDQMPDGFKTLSTEIAKGNYSVKQLEQSVKNLNKSNSQLAKTSSAANTKRIQEQKVIIGLLQQEIANQKVLESGKARVGAAQAASLSALSQRESTIFATMGDSTLGKIDKTAGVFKQTTSLMAAHVKEAVRVSQVGATNNKVFGTMNKVLGAGVGVTRAAAVGFKVLGASLVNMIPVIGQLLFAFSLLKMAWDFFKKENPVKKAGEEALESLKDLTKAEAQLATTLDLINNKLADTEDKDKRRLLEAQKITAEYRAQAGALSSVGASILAITQAQREQNLESLQALRTEVREREQKAKELADRIKSQETGFVLNFNKGRAAAAEDKARRTREEYDALLRSMKEVSKETKNQILANIEYAKSVGLVTDKKGLQALIEELNKTNPSMTKVEALARQVGVEIKNLDSIFQGAAQEGSSLQKTLLELGGKGASKVTPLVDAFRSIKNNMDKIVSVNTTKIASPFGTTQVQNTEKIAEDLEAYLLNLGLSADFLKEKFNNLFTPETVSGFLERLEKIDESLKTSKLQLDSAQTILGILAEDRDKDLASREKYLDQEEKIRKLKVSQLQATIKLNEVTLTNTEAAILNVPLQQKLNALLEEELTEQKKRANLLKFSSEKRVEELDLVKEITTNTLTGIAAIREQDRIEKEILSEKIKQLSYDYQIEESSEERARIAVQILAILSKIPTLQDTELKASIKLNSEKEKLLQLEQANVQLAERMAGYSKTISDAEASKLKYAQILKNLEGGGRAELTPQQELEIFERLRKSRLQAIVQEYNLKMELISLEFKLERLKTERQLIELKNQRDKITDTDERGVVGEQISALEQFMNKLGEVEGLAKKANEATMREAVRGVELEGLTLKQMVDDLVAAKDIFEGAKKSFQDNLAGSFKSVIDGTQTVKEAFIGLAQTILDSIAEIAAANLAKSLVGQSGSITGDSGIIGTIVSEIAGAFSGTKTAGARYGGIINNGEKVKGYATGGIATGPDSGYLTTLHGKEAVVPLPNGNSIPVEMKNGGATNNNVVVNVSVDGKGGARTESMTQDSEMAGKLGLLVSNAIKEELIKQKRPGGILSPYGAA